MFSKLAVLASVAVLAVATPNPMPSAAVASTSDGGLQCCNTVANASDPASASALGPLSVLLTGLTGMVGIDCSPITVSLF